MREIEMTGKTVELAVQAACDALGVDRDDINVSYEVLDFPVKKLFKTIPARVRVTLDEPETAAPAAEPAAPEAAPQAPKAEEPAQTAPAAAPAEEAAPQEPKAEPKAEAAEVELDIAADERLTAAVDYLRPICEMMGASNLVFTAVKKGEATILRIKGDHVGVLIGRRGETMESLSYLTSLVCYYEMEPMNPYERHIIHTAVAAIEGVRSESKGEGADRRVVIYSTDSDACNLPDRESGRRGRGGNRSRDNSRSRNGGRGGRGGFRGDSRKGGERGGRGGRSGGRGGNRSGSRGSYVPGREFADTPRDPNARPQAPAPVERIHDGDDFAMFGKIEL